MSFKSQIITLLVAVILAISNAAASAEETAVENVLHERVIAKDTIIKVQAVNTISSQNSKQKEKVHFKVSEDITVGDVIIIAANTDVEAVVTKVQKAGPWDKDGQLEIIFSEITTKEGYSIPVTGFLQLRGDKPNVLVKYSLGGIFIKGKEAVIKAGTEAQLRIKEDIRISGDKRNPPK